MILAGIDIGTNTLRLLLADTGPDSFKEIYSDRKITRLGERLDRTGLLSEDACRRSMTVLADFASRIRAYSASAVAAVGTSALRNAANAAAFVGEVQRRTGIGIRVVSGEEEARLTLLGVARSLKTVRDKGEKNIPPSAVVIDIGGGSTEIIFTDPPREISLPLGAVYLTERFIRHDPPRAEELDLLRQAVREVLETALLPRGFRILIGTAGTITTLASMDQRLNAYDPEKINNFNLKLDSIDRIVHHLTRSTLPQRRGIAGLEQGREDIILAGAMIVQEIMKHFKHEKMMVSDWGLREGILLDLYDKLLKRADGRHDPGSNT